MILFFFYLFRCVAVIKANYTLPLLRQIHQLHPKINNKTTITSTDTAWPYHLIFATLTILFSLYSRKYVYYVKMLLRFYIYLMFLWMFYFNDLFYLLLFNSLIFFELNWYFFLNWIKLKVIWIDFFGIFSLQKYFNNHSFDPENLTK